MARKISIALLIGTLCALGGPAPAAEEGRQRMFDLPRIDKSKVEDPYKGVPPPTQPQAHAPTAAKPAALAAPAPVAAPKAEPSPAAPRRPVLKMPELKAAQEMTRQQRELMLATSGPRKAASRKATAPVEGARHTAEHVHWSYHGPGAPEHWGRLQPDYATCSTGRRQSPIDIREGIRVDLEPIAVDYRFSHFSVIDNGHSIEVKVAEGNSITVMGRTYRLEQVHFHHPAEERIEGRSFDMVAHLVHRSYDNRIAVIAVLLQRGTVEHPVVQIVWNHLPLEVGMVVSPPAAALDLAGLLPERRDYYTYMGSLTTPPCTEDVLWMVFKEPVTVSDEQIAIFARLYPNNARPLQPAQGRLIKGSR